MKFVIPTSRKFTCELIATDPCLRLSKYWGSWSCHSKSKQKISIKLDGGPRNWNMLVKWSAGHFLLTLSNICDLIARIPLHMKWIVGKFEKAFLAYFGSFCPKIRIFVIIQRGYMFDWMKKTLLIFDYFFG